MKLDLALLKHMHPLLPATTAAGYEYRAAVGLGRHGHRPGAALAATIENQPRAASVHWRRETTVGGEQLDRQRVTEDAAEAMTLALVHVAVRRRLQRGEHADWLLVDSDRRHVALEVSGTDHADDRRRLRDKLQQVSQVTSTHRRADLFADPEGSGIATCLELKARLADELRADVLLIDARTGIAELAGVATTLLADKVVCLFLNNRESLTGTRAVMRSLSRAVRPKGQAPIEVLPVLSRVPDLDQGDAATIVAFLNEPGSTPEETLSIRSLFTLRVDPDLARSERLYVGSGEPARRSPLHQDYLDLLATLVTADPGRALASARRQEALREIREWLTDRYESRRDRRLAPEGFRSDQIDEGVTFGAREARYADLVAYAGQDRSEALMAVEYVEDLASSEAWRWWQDNSKLRCVVLVGKKDNERATWRVFTRGRRVRRFTERDDFSGWAVRWPLSFSAMDDPGDRSVQAMLAAVQQGADEYIGMLVREWQRASFVTLHGGAPFRPALARRILDGLARVHNVETETRILWRTAPDPHQRSDEGLGDGAALEELTTHELHAPLWWRLSVEAKVEFVGHIRSPHGGRCTAGLDLLARDVMGLTLDQDRDFRRDVQPLLERLGEHDDTDAGAYRFADLFSARELKFALVDEPPPELIRRVALRQRRGKPMEELRPGPAWDLAEREARRALQDDMTLSSLLRDRAGRPDIVTTNLLGLYDPASCRVTLYRPLIEWCARVLDVHARALANVVFLHETVHAICHLGRDLDGRAWDEFALPSSRDPAFRPSALHERLAQCFSHRLIARLEDAQMLAAFERLSDHGPAEYQAWRKLHDVPLEGIRRLLMQARAAFDDAPGATTRA